MKYSRILACCALLVMVVAAAPALAQDISGTWMDPEIQTIYEIQNTGNGYQVVFSQDLRDGEICQVTESTYVGGQLQWTILIPSMGYYLSYKVTGSSGNQLYTEWWDNQGASGTEVLSLQSGGGNVGDGGNVPPVGGGGTAPSTGGGNLK